METPTQETTTSNNRLGRNPFGGKPARVLKTGEKRAESATQTAAPKAAATEAELALLANSWLAKAVRFGAKSWLIARYLATHPAEWTLSR